MNHSSVGWPMLKRNLVAILRGIGPEEIEGVVDALVEAGFEAIEVPLNSPEPFASIEKARRLAPPSCLIGAGTVLEVEQVDRLRDVGGDLLVTPNVEPAVIQRAVQHGMVTMPGVFTATEALRAAKAGAGALKFFPASVLGPQGINAIRAILPPGLPIGAVGGVSQTDFAAYLKVGVTCFGLGSSLYKPGDSAAAVSEKAERTVAAYDTAVSV
ncbi:MULTISPECIES: 2-dehydro-3-deoxy-6-phosphogalactonate aldolase [Alphaproteobacteria]|uniref:2-dehydro-3-deoxy-6-phosphogalactonate aldolase n=2 Tax=Alphaproteobacteria TaxID=28211 RepID=A0A512HKB5_9HYPH|nr:MULTISPECIES: 2-dehydro-3-deoxy-6-phosphogalactonate aldolase [Alphaproteobacteria]GEO85887.1 2-dehydro-3-deoxy-6-phosphogalactonate aldolase [Ciceribacter naphthalenivorans]GLR21743.1 2-dehydro-3-deoxy-6-phosphogalactonate aldolase [Ciceribacter naphthalenivorans]GLT04599.1 2-dehydro-3-deoxy-6-phosphogalactonate aldolase [Sphingomonas psychrolutea]